MGMTIEYATLTEWELQPIMAGGAREIVDGILRECKQGDINPRFRERLEAILIEFWDDPKNLIAKQKLDSDQREEQLRFQKQYLAGSRLIESSQYRNFLRSENAPASALDELCEYFASGGYLFLYDKAEQVRTADAVRSLSQERSASTDPGELNALRAHLSWYDKVREIGLSEDELTAETKKRGLRFVLDLMKEYRNLHPLLPGEHYPGFPEPNDLLSLALYGENDVPKDSCPKGLSNERDPWGGSGPPRYVTSASVRDIGAFFSGTSFADLVQKNGLDPETDWAGGDVFDRLKSFYLRVAQAGDGVLVFFL